MEFDKGQFWSAMLGDYSLTDFVVFAVFFLLGAILYFGFDVRQAVKKDKGTPRKFNWWFMLKDNVLRFFVVIIAIFTMIIFYEDFFGVPLNQKLAFTMGLSIDAIIGKAVGGVKEIPAIKKQRDAFISKLKS